MRSLTAVSTFAAALTPLALASVFAQAPSRALTMEQIRHRDSIWRASVTALSANQFDSAAALAEAAVKYAAEIGDESLTHFRAQQGRVELLLAQHLAATGDVRRAAVHALHAAELGLAGGDSILGTWHAADSGYVYYRRYATEAMRRGHLDSAAVALDGALEIAHTAERAHYGTFFNAMTAPATLARARLRALSEDWVGALSDYRAMWASRDSLVAPLAAYSALGAGLAHYALHHPDSALFYWSGPSRSDPYPGGMTCATDAERTRDAAYVALHQVTGSDTALLRVMDVSASEVPDAGRGPGYEIADELPPLPELLGTSDLASERTRAYLHSMPWLGHAEAISAALIASEGVAVHEEIDSLNVADARRRSRTYYDVRSYPGPCNYRIIGVDELVGAASEIADRIRSRGQTALVYRILGDTLAVFAVTRAGDVLVETRRFPPALPGGRAVPSASDSLRLWLLPETIAPLVPDTGAIVLVRDSALASVPFTRMFRRARILLASSIVEYAVRLGPSPVHPATASAAKLEPKPLEATATPRSASCVVPVAPRTPPSILLARAKTATDSFRVFKALASRLFEDIAITGDTLRIRQRDSVANRWISPRRDSALAFEEVAVLSAMHARDTLAASRLEIALGEARAKRADDWRDKLAGAWRDSAATSFAVAADLANKGRLPAFEYRALDQLLDLTSSDDSTAALSRRRVALARELGDRDGEARALVSLGNALPRNAPEQRAAFLRAARLAFEDPEYAHALADLPQDLSYRLERLIPWDDGLATSSSSVFYSLPSTLPQLRLLAVRLENAGDLTNAGRLLDAIGTVFQDRVVRYSVDSAMLDSARRTLREAYTLRVRANDARGAARTLLHMASVERSIARDTSQLAPVRRLLDSAIAVATRGNALDVIAQARRERALAEFSAHGNRAQLIHDLSPLWSLSIGAGDTTTAIATLTELGELHASVETGLDSASRELGTAVDLSEGMDDATLAGKSEETLSILLRALGRADSAATLLRTSLGHAQAIGDEKVVLSRSLLLADVLGDLGRLPDARSVLNSALDRSAPLRTRDITDAGATLRLLGRIQVQLRHYDSAAAAFTRAAYPSASREDLAAWSEVLRHAGCIDSANTAMLAALDASTSNAIVDRIHLAKIFDVIADLQLRARSRIDSAIRYREWAAAIWQRAHVDSAAAHQFATIARLYDRLGRSDSASFFDRVAGDRSAAIAAADAKARVARTRADSDEAEHDPLEEARLLVAAGDRARPTSVRAASDQYQRASRLLTALMRGSPSEPNRIAAAARLEQVYERWSLAALTDAARLGVRRSELIALALADRGRGQVLEDIRETTQFQNDSVVSAIERFTTTFSGANRDSALTISTGAQDTVVNEAGLEAQGEQLLATGGFHQQVLSYLLTADTLVVWLRSYHNGEYEIMTAPPRRIRRDSVAALVRALRDHLGVDGVLTRAASGSSTTEHTRGLVAGLVGDTAKLHTTVATLSAILLPPQIAQALAPAGELVIVPHGILGVLPFAALAVPGDREPLGARFALRYGPSLASLGEIEFTSRIPLFQSRRWRAGPQDVLDDRGTPYRDSVAWRRSALILGAPVLPSKLDGFELGPLDSAASEVRTIAGYFGVEPFLGAGASELTLRQRLADATVVHLATHGIAFADPSESRKSFLALAASPGSGTSGDGVLSVSEIVDERAIHTQADLVVLSACQTGFGEFNAAEGVLGLQRAFLAKGALSVMGSLWSVDDEATNALMTSFYRHWLSDSDHPSKAEALRRAQNDVRTDPLHKTWSNPRFWAAFQLVGAD